MATSEAPHLHSLSKVCGLTSLSKTVIYREIRKGHFPAPIRISARRIAWRDDDLREWMNSCASNHK